MAKEFKLTQESLDKLKEELEYLKTVREKEVAEQIKEARSFGDLSENSEYDEAKNEQGKLYSRIAEVENIIAHAVVITDDMYGQDAVSYTHLDVYKRQSLCCARASTIRSSAWSRLSVGMSRHSSDCPWGRLCWTRHWRAGSIGR